MNLEAIVYPLLKREESHFYVAFSGGLDSTVLLHLLAHSPLKSKLSAIHINHQLSQSADDWQQHCTDVCEQWEVPFHIEQVSVSGEGGVEAAARKARYEVFEKQVGCNECLLTGHHQNDQIETLLYRLFRGAGPEGLAAMPKERELGHREKDIGQGVLYRPFLNVPRNQLEAYATTQGLIWVEDDSNISTEFDRNFIRHELIPIIENRWPGSGNCIARAASLCRDQATLNQLYGEQLLGQLQPQSERLGVSISGEILDAYSKEEQSLVLRHWIKSITGVVPEASQLALVIPQVWLCFEDAKPCLRFDQWEIRRFQKRLYLLPQLLETREETSISYQLNGDELLVNLPGVGLLKVALELCVHLKKQGIKQLDISYRQGGERCKPIGRGHSQKLKKLLQEYQLEPWLRDWVPLIYSDDVLIAVGDLWLCESELLSSDQLTESMAFGWSFPIK